MSIKAKQVAGVTTLVVLVVAVLIAYHLAALTRLNLQETSSQGELLAQAVLLRADEVVRAGHTDPYAALRNDGGVRSILKSSLTYPYVIYAAIVDPQGRVVAHSFTSQEGSELPEQADLRPIVTMGPIAQLSAVYSDRTFEIRQPIEIRQPMLAGDTPFGSIRIGVSPMLVRSKLQDALPQAAAMVVAALLISSLVAILLAQWMLRPIHVIQSGLSRLGRGELDVTLDLPEHEFRDLGSSFEAVSAQLSAVRAKGVPGAGPTDFESVMDNLEDAVALFSPGGELIFCNTTMRGVIGDLTPAEASRAGPSKVPSRVQDLVHPEVRGIVERTLAGRRSEGPVSISVDDAPQRLLMSHAIQDTGGRFLGAMLVARNLGYLSHVHSTLNYSQKLAALGRLMAGVAHEVKNPLNAMAIHLELLKRKLASVAESVPVGMSDSGGFPLPPSPEASVVPDVTKHVNIISEEIRRLDQVVAGFLKFARPDDLKLQPVQLDTLISDVATTVAPEAGQRNVAVKIDCPSSLPEINADPAMLRQALLNLALNACQAMPQGGTLRISCRAAAKRRVEIDVEDTGVGIPPENLGRVFDLYFTTKEKGSGIGLSMVFRIVQLHDGEVEVQSTPGMGTRFRLAFPQASQSL